MPRNFRLRARFRAPRWLLPDRSGGSFLYVAARLELGAEPVAVSALMMQQQLEQLVRVVVAQRTTIANKREVLYSLFALWLSDYLPGHSVSDLVRSQPSTLAEWVSEFVLHTYTTLGWSRTKTSEAMLAITDRHPTTRGMLGGADNRPHR